MIREDLVGGTGTFALVKAVRRDGLAERSGRGFDVVREGDRVLELQGMRLCELTTEQVRRFLWDTSALFLTNILMLFFLRSADAAHRFWLAFLRGAAR